MSNTDINEEIKSAKAVLRNLRVSPQKLNLVAGLIRGKSVALAANLLQFSHKRISTDVLKCLKSAMANAEENHDMDVDSLKVSEAYVGKNLTMKRMRPRARGRGARVIKSFSQLTIILTEEEVDSENRSFPKSPENRASKPVKSKKASTNKKEAA